MEEKFRQYILKLNKKEHQLFLHQPKIFVDKLLNGKFGIHILMN